MGNYYWLKLHFDLLDDWKVGTLADSLKWRFIQCLLVAGEQQEDGFLPPLQQFAFRIRPMTVEALENDLSHLARAGLTELRLDENDDERWFVTNYMKRQSKKTNAERQAEWRKRNRNSEDTNPLRDSNDQSNGNVTTRYTDKIRIEEIRGEEEEIRVRLKNALAAVAKDTLGAGFNENRYDVAANVVAEKGMTVEQVDGFGPWWEACGLYDGRPALKSVLYHLDDYLTGRSLRKEGNGKQSVDDLAVAANALED